MLATGSTGVSSNPIPEHFNSGEEKLFVCLKNPSSKIVQDAASEMKSLSTEDAVRTLEEHGAFLWIMKTLLKPAMYPPLLYILHKNKWQKKASNPSELPL